MIKVVLYDKKINGALMDSERMINMKNALTRISWNSIRFKLVVGLLLLTVPTVILLIYNNDYAIKVVHSKVAESNKNLLMLYMEQIDDNLNDIDKYLTNIIVNDNDLQELEYYYSEKSRVMAKVRLDNRLKADISSFSSIDSIFVYTVSGQDYLEVFQDYESIGDRILISDYVQSAIKQFIGQQAEIKSQWYVQQINEKHYLFRFLQTNDAFVGAWTNIEKLAVPLDLLNLGEDGVSLFANSETAAPITNSEVITHNKIDLSKSFENYYLSEGKEPYLVLSQKSTKANLSLVALFPDKKILDNLPYLRAISLTVPIGGIILLPICLLVLRRMVLRPLNRIMAAMKRIGEGNLNVRIESFPTSNEFKLVNETFNKMIEQVKELRIHVYEEKLNKQKAELQHLQLQINPHFYMNALNIIYNLAHVRNYELIQEMSLSLVQYFRYMFRSNLTFVPLKAELKHTQNYIRIQELRFPQRISFKLNVPDYLLDMRIPPLVIQTFVENSIKYGITSEEAIDIVVEIELEEEDYEPRISILIQDSGNGFSEENLNEIAKGNRIEDESGEHIGIWNVRRRLGLLYDGQAKMEVSNAVPHGAMVHLMLPINDQ